MKYIQPHQSILNRFLTIWSIKRIFKFFFEGCALVVLLLPLCPVLDKKYLSLNFPLIACTNYESSNHFELSKSQTYRITYETTTAFSKFFFVPKIEILVRNGTFKVFFRNLCCRGKLNASIYNLDIIYKSRGSSKFRSIF